MKGVLYTTRSLILLLSSVGVAMSAQQSGRGVPTALEPDTESPPSADAAFPAATSSASVQVYVAYADNRTAAAFFPRPWYYSPNLDFVATHGPAYDTGAIMIVNNGTTAAVLSRGASVDGFNNGKVYRVWDGLIPAPG
jgi:hypothetical protein